MSNGEVESRFDGLMLFCLWKTWFSFDGFFHEIPHSCLEYGMRETGWKKDLVHPSLWSGGSWKSQTWLTFASLIWGYLSLLIHEYYTGLNVDYMAFISLVFLLLLCCLWTSIMKVAQIPKSQAQHWGKSPRMLPCPWCGRVWSLLDAPLSIAREYPGVWCTKT